MNTAEHKEALRKQLLDRRRSINEETYVDVSERITQRLKQQPEFLQAKVLHCYVSLTDRGEIDTEPLIRELLKKEKQVVVPVTDFDTETLKHVVLESYDDLKPNKWGVPEPEMGNEVDPAELELVIVPMVAGDEERNRLGYGKGFYDRFLAETGCPAIGLCFEQCMVEKIPVEPFDIRLNKIITQDRVIG